MLDVEIPMFFYTLNYTSSLPSIVLVVNSNPTNSQGLYNYFSVQAIFKITPFRYFIVHATYLISPTHFSLPFGTLGW